MEQTGEKEMQKNAHAIMISIPSQGHINPLVNLALKLASKGIIVTFVHLDHVHHAISKAHHSKDGFDLFSHARESGLDIRYTTISDGFPLEFDRFTFDVECWETRARDFAARVAQFVGKTMDSDPNDVYFLVADTLYEWPAAVAQKFKLIYVSFWTEPALVFSLFYHWDLLAHNHHFPCPDDVKDDINYIPGVDSINIKDLPSVFKESESFILLIKMTQVAFKEVKKADFILHNTVHELEPQTLSALNKYQPNYAIGPCINFNTTTSLLSESDCTHWLESKPPGSVLYVSFGSILHLNKHVMDEISNGLLLSEVHFIWVVRPGSAQVLPDGFEDEIKDRGLIVPWCNQMDVLSSPAVGGFLTHNGWNSTLESVPMICYPDRYDQLTNRKMVVDDWRIGVNLCDGASVYRKEVSEKIKSVINGGYSKSMRQEAFKLRGILRNAVKINQGSSERNFDQFVKDLQTKLFRV